MNFIKQLQEQYSIILASSSPRRKQLLASLGFEFKSITPDVDEKKMHFGNIPQNCCQFLSIAKANSIYYDIIDANFSKPKIIIAADTIVVLDNQIINKPKDIEDAINILKKLSDRKHFVFTGLSVLNSASGDVISRCAKTAVYFRKLSENEIVDYVKTGSPLDKAGAYGIQDAYGSLFVKNICGDYNNVVGLPLVLLYEILFEKFGNVCRNI